MAHNAPHTSVLFGHGVAEWVIDAADICHAHKFVSSLMVRLQNDNEFTDFLKLMAQLPCSPLTA
jgi:hypothetical protein